jgi:hypothetical protein
MKKYCSLLFIGLALCLAPTVCLAGSPIPIDVLYMNHGPLQPTIRELRALFPKYGEQLAVSWYDFDSDAGERFKSKMGITRHTPLIIWIDGRSEITAGDRTIKFEGFPSGSGPSFFQGKWKLEDLVKVLDRMTAGK